MPPVKQRDEQHWRKYYTAARPNKWVYDRVGELMDGLDFEPRVLQENGDVSAPETIPNVIEAVVEEIARQHHGIAIYACAMWREEGDQMVTTQAMHLPDARPEVGKLPSATMQHFAHFALGHGGISGGLNAENAYPMPWPDFGMAARPALPPRHPNWEQEKDNLIDWFGKLWSWQGGYEDLQWAVLVKDINTGNFEYFNKDRLPTEYVREKDRHKLTVPAEWDEETTAIWLSCRPRLEDARAFIRKARQAREGEVRASVLYDHVVQLVAEIGGKVRGLDNLLEKLRKYESFVPADVATIPAVERSHDWHPAAAQVSRALETFAGNTDLAKHIFPKEFLSRLAQGHHRWDVTALRDWVQSKPFWDDGAKMMRGGTAGIAVAFFAVLHCALNVARVMPKDEEDADRLCDQDKVVYGRADFRTLSQCAEAIAQQLAECAISELAQLRLTSSDFEDRYSAWSPKVWVQRDSDGEEQVATFTTSRPSFNVFLANANSYLEPLGSTAAGTPDRSAHVTPEPPAVESGAADITHAAEDGVSGQADVSMNDPGIHLALDVAGQEALDFGATETRNEDVESAGFEGAMTRTSCGEGQARQAVVLDPTIQAGEPRATESPIASKSPTPSCDLQPTKPAEEQPPVTVAAAVPSLRDENPSTTKLWKFSERLRAASTVRQQPGQKGTSNMNADSGSRGSGSGAGSPANVSRKRARAKLSSDSAAPEMSKKAK